MPSQTIQPRYLHTFHIYHKVEVNCYEFRNRMYSQVELYSVKNPFYLTLTETAEMWLYCPNGVNKGYTKKITKAVCTVIPVKAFPKPFACNVAF